MPLETIKIPVLNGGVSRQPTHMRLANQTETFTNAMPSVVDGCSKRPGSRFVCTPTLTSGSPAQMHPIHRDDSEKYLLLAQRSGSASLQVRSVAGTDCPVYISSDSQTYLDDESPAASDFRFVTIADYTLIGNAKVPMESNTSPAYLVTGDRRDFGQLISSTPEVGTYWRTRNADGSFPAGHFQYLPGGNTYATILFPKTNGSQANSATFWGGSTNSNPVGFSIFFSVGGLALTGAAWTAATRTLQRTGAFANVSAGDWVNITGGTGATADYYQIQSKTSANIVILASSAGATDQTDYTLDGVGKVAFVVRDFQQDSAADMHEVAKNVERAIRSALGGLEACCEWIADDPTGVGHFRVTSPYAGTSSSFPATGATRSVPSARYPVGVTALGNDLTNASGDSFYSTGATVTAGTGDAGPTTGPVLDRWVRKPPPNQAGALLDPATMLQQMIRLNPAGTYPGGYVQFTRDLKPFAYWRFGEASGTIAADELEANNGTYISTPTLAAAGALNGDTNTAVSLDGSTEYVNLGALAGWGPGLSRPFTFEAWVKINDTTESVLFCSGSDSVTGYFRVEISYDNLGDNSGYITADLLDKSGNRLSVVSNAATTVNNNTYRHLVVTMNPAAGTGAIYLDGVLVASTATASGICTNFGEFLSGECAIGARIGLASAASLFITGRVDEAVLYQGLFSASMALARYNQGANSAFSHSAIFGVFPVEWVPRFSGDELTNPVPTFIEKNRKLSDMAYFRNRLEILSHEQLGGSQDGDFFNLFLDDADNISDADPVEKSLSTTQVTIGDFLTPVRKSLLVTTRADQQFELGTGTSEEFTPTKGSLAQSTSLATTQGVRPAKLNTSVYLATASGSYTAIREYQAQESFVPGGEPPDITAHVDTFLPTVSRLATCGTVNMVLALGTDSAIYVYRYFYVGDQKDMSAWAKWSFSEAYTIRDIAVIGTDLFLLVNANSAHTIERIPLARVAAETNFPWVVNTDRTFAGLSGTFGGANTTFTLPGGLVDNTINRVVKSDGTVYTATSVAGVVTVSGQNLAGATVLIGRSYDLSVQLSRAHARNQDGTARLGTEVDHRETVYRLTNSGDITVTTTGSAAAATTSRVASTAVPAGTLDSFEFRVNHPGNAKTLTNTITSSDCRPVTISSIDYAVETTSRSAP